MELETMLKSIPDASAEKAHGIGELLQLAVQEIIRLRGLTVTDKEYSLLRDIGEYLHVEEYNDGARKDALNSYFDLYDSIFEAEGPAHDIGDW